MLNKIKSLFKNSKITRYIAILLVVITFVHILLFHFGKKVIIAKFESIQNLIAGGGYGVSYDKSRYSYSIMRFSSTYSLYNLKVATVRLKPGFPNFNMGVTKLDLHVSPFGYVSLVFPENIAFKVTDDSPLESGVSLITNKNLVISAFYKCSFINYFKSPYSCSAKTIKISGNDIRFLDEKGNDVSTAFSKLHLQYNLGYEDSDYKNCFDRSALSSIKKGMNEILLNIEKKASDVGAGSINTPKMNILNAIYQDLGNKDKAQRIYLLLQIVNPEIYKGKGNDKSLPSDKLGISFLGKLDVAFFSNYADGKAFDIDFMFVGDDGGGLMNLNLSSECVNNDAKSGKGTAYNVFFAVKDYKRIFNGLLDVLNDGLNKAAKVKINKEVFNEYLKLAAETLKMPEQHFFVNANGFTGCDNNERHVLNDEAFESVISRFSSLVEKKHLRKLLM